MEKTYLDLEEVASLLPEELKFDKSNKIERSIYRTKEGKILPVINSKFYEKNSMFWYSCITDYFKKIGVEQICFTAGLLGIFLIPIKVVSHYNMFSGWKRDGYKGRQFHVRIKQLEDGSFCFINYNDHREDIDITKYFIRFS